MKSHILNLGPCDVLCVRSDEMQQCIELLRERPELGVKFCARSGWDSDHIGLLREVQPKHVYFGEYAGVLDELHSLSHLETLCLPDHARADLSAFPGLRILYARWSKSRIEGLGSHRAIRDLTLYGYNSGRGDLRGLPTSIERLMLVTAQATSCDRLACQATLSDFEIHNSPKLERIDGLAGCLSLKRIFIEHSRKLTDHASVADLPNLEKLAFINCGSMPSVGFARGMKRLTSFVMLDTDVSDGDLSVLKEHSGLRHVAITDKRDFNVRQRELPSVNPQD